MEFVLTDELPQICREKVSLIRSPPVQQGLFVEAADSDIVHTFEYRHVSPVLRCIFPFSSVREE
jgi:hypothetical protein